MPFLILGFISFPFLAFMFLGWGLVTFVNKYFVVAVLILAAAVYIYVRNILKEIRDEKKGIYHDHDEIIIVVNMACILVFIFIGPIVIEVIVEVIRTMNYDHITLIEAIREYRRIMCS